MAGKIQEGLLEELGPLTQGGGHAPWPWLCSTPRGPVTGGVREWPPHLHGHPGADPRPGLSEGDVQSGQQAPVSGDNWCVF